MTAPEIDMPVADRWRRDDDEPETGVDVVALDSWSSYLRACEAENLDPVEPTMWAIAGRPLGPIGERHAGLAPEGWRCAWLTGNGISLARVAALLPERYYVWGWAADGESVIIVGEDDAGWDLDGFVLPRLASGSIFGKEVFPHLA